MTTELESSVENVGFFARIRNFSITFAALIIAIGSWNDSVDFIGQVYDVVKSQFTHQVEYEKLAKVQVGVSKEFVQEQFGAPQLVRVKSGVANNGKVVFSYYLHKKYVLLLGYEDEQVTAFFIVGLVNDFKPENIINLELVTQFNKIDEAIDEVTAVAVSLGSSAYITEQELGKDNLFLKRYLGFAHNSTIPHVHEKLSRLENAIVNQSEPEIETTLTDLNQHSINSFGLGYLPVDLVASALLTRQEMKIYTQGSK